MSAFLVGKPHIDALINAGLVAGERGHLSWYVGETRYELRSDNAHEVGRMLWHENALSVAYRYHHAVPDATDGYTVTLTVRRLDPVAVLKAIDCFDYQSCEHPGWEASQAHAFCNALRRAMIHALPGYAAAAWEVRA